MLGLEMMWKRQPKFRRWTIKNQFYIHACEHSAFKAMGSTGTLNKRKLNIVWTVFENNHKSDVSGCVDVTHHFTATFFVLQCQITIETVKSARTGQQCRRFKIYPRLSSWYSFFWKIDLFVGVLELTRIILNSHHSFFWNAVSDRSRFHWPKWSTGLTTKDFQTTPASVVSSSSCATS